MSKKEEKEEKSLGWRDYVALAIAMLTTCLLPMIIFIVLLLVLLLFLRG